VVDFYEDNHPQEQHCDEFDPGKHSSTLLTDAAIDLLKKNTDKEKPFFMYLAYLAPHDPRTMPDKFREMYDVENITLPPNFQELIDTNYPLMVHRDEHLASYPRKAEEIKRHIAEYYAMITHLDFEIGRLFEALHQSGEEDNTIIVFTGDNGLAVGQHGWLGKEDIYEHGVRIPLIMAGPGINQNKKNEAFVYLYDVFPTLCEKVGIEIPESVDGKSFAHLLESEKENAFRDELYLIFDKFVRGVKDDNYKLIEYRNGDKAEDKWTFLYDIKNDPWETENLAGIEAYSDKIDEMREKMLKHRDQWEEQSHPWGIDFWERL
jgi:arylsulfatase A-like enzyme